MDRCAGCQAICSEHQLSGEWKESLPLYNNKVYTAAQPSLHVERLSPETTYEITLQANRGSYSSDVYTQQFTTAAIPFSKYYVTDVKATAVGKTGFTASWKGMEAADDYVVTLISAKNSRVCLRFGKPMVT